MAKLGSATKQNALLASLAEHGARDPGALAAYIARKKAGAGRMAKVSAAGRTKTPPRSG